MIGTDIAIDLGTSRFKVYLDGKGIVISEPSIIAVDNLTEEVIAVGGDAYNMLGRTSERITVSRPRNNGVISAFAMAEQRSSASLRQRRPSRWGNAFQSARPPAHTFSFQFQDSALSISSLSFAG